MYAKSSFTDHASERLGKSEETAILSCCSGKFLVPASGCLSLAQYRNYHGGPFGLPFVACSLSLSKSSVTECPQQWPRRTGYSKTAQKAREGTVHLLSSVFH